MENQLPGGSHFKEISRQYQQVLHGSSDGYAFLGAHSSPEASIAPVHQPRVGSEISPGFCDRNLQFSGFNPSMASNAGCGMLIPNNGYTSPRVGSGISPGFRDHNLQFSGFNGAMASNTGCGMLNNGYTSPRVGSGISPGFRDHNLQFSGFNGAMASNTGYGMLSPNNGYTSPYFPKSGMVVSPDQLSSVMAGSDAELSYSGREIREAETTYPIGGFSELTPGLGLRKRHVSRDIHSRDYITQDMQPLSKRMKIVNVVQRDDWSLDAIISSHLEQRVGGQVDNTTKTNEEVISFKEVPTSVATWNANAKADEGGLTFPNVCFGQMARLLGPRHSLGGSILNKEVLSCMGKAGKNNVVSHPEVVDLVDEHSEMDCIMSNVTFDYPSTSPDNISILPQVSSNDEGESTKITTDDFKKTGVSLIDFFTSEQIKVHLCSLNPCLSQDVGKGLSGKMSAPTVGPNTCQLCVKDGLTFSAPAMYCTSCGAQIKHKSTYYWTQDGTGTRSCFCTKCFKISHGGSISFRGLSFSKASLHKEQNTEESSEPWVQCDNCEQWQHQICALYNSERDLKGKVKYSCPFCRLAEIEAKANVSIPPAFGARDLPRTKLSDHIEQRLFKSLEQEWKQRAVGKNDEEVPGASDLTVRVVLAVDKQVKVKQQYLDIFHDETYPTEFPYKSKVILLFQKIEGVDVCIFAMYVQEYGSECGNPNKRSVYISYLDSVKYFRPEVKTCYGVPLRTFVYHEILIGYLDYCKRRGFVTCYIWACPSIKGDDYILHCHPEEQKMPKSNKLVQWYKKMLKKAKDENVVAGSTNFYDHFFVSSGGSNCKIPAARLPYFDGDYWSGAIMDFVQTIEKDGEGNSERQSKHQMTQRTMRAMGHKDRSVDARKVLVMHELEQTMMSKKDDFFVVHLLFTCSRCHEAILSGDCWSCNQCRKFHICRRCREPEQSTDGSESHTNKCGKKHQLYQTPVNDAAGDTEDKDEVSVNNLFGDRCSFLEFSQKNHYQFDSLRRAKHSSMMILHHLKTSEATTVETVCSICKQDSVVGWHCEICSEFNVCNACYQKKGGDCHVHKLVPTLTEADSEKKSKQLQQRTEADSGKRSKQILQRTEADSEKRSKQILQRTEADSEKKSEQFQQRTEAVCEIKIKQLQQRAEADSEKKSKQIQQRTGAESEKRSKQILQRTEADFEKRSKQIQQRTEADFEKRSNQILQRNSEKRSRQVQQRAEADSEKRSKQIQQRTEAGSEKRSKLILLRTEADSEKKSEQLEQRTEADSEKKINQLQQRIELEAGLMQILNHANQCRENPCPYKKCVDMKKLFLHAAECKVGVRGGCAQCRKIWTLLLLHSRNCTDSYCSMPRCTEIRCTMTTQQNQVSSRVLR